MLTRQTAQTHCVRRSQSPRWGETFQLVSTRPSSLLSLVAYDWDGGAADEFIGETRVSLGRFLDKGEVELTCVLGNEGAAVAVDQFKVTYGPGFGVAQGQPPATFGSAPVTRGTVSVRIKYTSSLIGMAACCPALASHLAIVCSQSWGCGCAALPFAFAGRPVTVGLTRRVDSAIERIALVTIVRQLCDVVVVAVWHSLASWTCGGPLSSKRHRS